MEIITATNISPTDNNETEQASHATGPAPGSSQNKTIHSNKPLGTTKLQPAAIFSHNMVLQREKPIAVFGTGEPGRLVSVRLSATMTSAPIRLCGGGTSDSITEICTIKDTGLWNVTLPSLEAGTSYELTISDHSGDMNLVYQNIAIGEVWLAGGQSNMEFELHQALDGSDDIVSSADAGLRFFNTPKFGTVDETLFDAEDAAAWQVCSPQTSGTMSAIAYYYGHRLRTVLGQDMSVGIIDCYVGGTSISCWLSQHTLSNSTAGRAYLERYHNQIDGKSYEEMRRETDHWQHIFDHWNTQISAAQAKDPNISWETLNAKYGECPWPPPMTTFSPYHPAGPHQAMVRRIAPYSLRGFLWYQGEEDEQYCDTYESMLTDLIKEWRKDWEEDSLPFLVVQLPQWIAKDEYTHGKDNGFWPILRQAQWNVSERDAHVFTVVLIDCGEFNNIHPVDKRTPGERIADMALSKIYGISSIPSDGPKFDNLVIQAKGTVVIRFKRAQGLYFKGTTPETYSSAVKTQYSQAAESGFEIAGQDGIYLPASAKIIQSSEECCHQVSLADTSSPDGGISAARVEDDESRTIQDDCILLSNPQVHSPVSIRYAWSSWGPAPLFNQDGLPCAPFLAQISPHSSNA